METIKTFGNLLAKLKMLILSKKSTLFDGAVYNVFPLSISLKYSDHCNEHSHDSVLSGTYYRI